MKPSLTGVEATSEGAVHCSVAGWGTIQAGPDMLRSMRQTPWPGAGQSISSSLLKHSDEQTVVGLAALFQAIERHDLAATDFTNWGVLAAPRFLGRTALTAALHRFDLEGAWGVSPHLIPHRSLHSLSGTVSQALGIHGPNFGVGGGPHSCAEVMLAAAAMIAECRVPGVWLLLTNCDPEPELEKSGSPVQHGEQLPFVYNGVAIALTPWTRDLNGPRMRIVPGNTRKYAPKVARAQTEHLLNIDSLQQAFSDGILSDRGWRLSSGGCLMLDRVEIRAENRL